MQKALKPWTDRINISVNKEDNNIFDVNYYAVNF